VNLNYELRDMDFISVDLLQITVGQTDMARCWYARL